MRQKETGKPANLAAPRPRIVSIATAAIMVNRSTREIYRLTAAGVLDAVKQGRSTGILVESIDRYEASLPRATFRSGVVNKAA